LKKSLFAGVFDSPTGEVSFAALGKKNMLQAVKEIFAGQPGRPKPVIDQPPAVPIAAKEVTVAASAAAPVAAAASASPSPPPAAIPAAPASVAAPPAGPSPTEGIERAAAGLIEAGVRFLESLATETGAAAPAEAPGSRIQQTVAGLFSRDPRTNRPALSIPLPESVTEGRLAKAIAGLLSALVR